MRVAGCVLDPLSGPCSDMFPKTAGLDPSPSLMMAPQEPGLSNGEGTGSWAFPSRLVGPLR